MAVSGSPTYALPAEEVTLAFTTTTAGTTARWKLTSVPDESALTEDEYLTDAAGEYIDTFTPDVPGAYAVQADIFRKVYGRVAYEGDIAGDEREAYTESQTATIYVGDVLDLPIVTLLGHGVTVRLGIFNATCRTAEFALPLTDASRVAALDATALASLATCVDVAVTALEDSLETTVTDVRAAYEAHRTHGASSVHVAADTVNVAAAKRPYAVVSAIETLNDVHDKMLAHMKAEAYHTAADTKNRPLCGKAETTAQAVVLSADLRWRVYNRHRLQTGSPAAHGSGGDSTNTLTAIKPLATVIRDYLDALLLATAPTGEQSGAVVALNALGFSRAA